MKNSSTLSGMLLSAALFALSACAVDPTDHSAESGDGAKELHMSVVIPGGEQNFSTRAITATQENTIQTVDVLAFRVDGSQETFDYASAGTLVSTNTAGATTQTFVANLRVAAYQQRFVVITNAHTEVSALTTNAGWKGAAKATMLAALNRNLQSGQDRWNASSASDYARIPMWGESTPQIIAETTTKLSSTIYLMRMVARIDVKLDTSVAGLTNQFKMKSVALYNTHTGGRIVPDASKVVAETQDGQPYYRVNAVSVPAGMTKSRGPINYTDFSAPGVTDVSMIGAIYTFEVPNSSVPAEATALVVGGLYGTDTTPSYYRVELYAAGSITTRVDLLRNHQYVVNITAVRARGHASVEEAFSSTAVNMTATVLAWNQMGMDNVAADGQNRLVTDKDQINLFSNEYTAALTTGENVVQVTTDVPAGWSVLSTTNGDGTAGGDWAKFTPASGSANTTTSVTVSATANTTGSERTAIVTLAAGRLRLPVRVVQSNRPALSLSIVDANTNQEIQQLVFDNPVGGTPPQTQSFRVNWLPATNPVSVTAMQVAQYEFPNPGGNPASADGAPYTGMEWPEKTGTKLFTVSPPAMTAAELNANPFLSKSSRFDMTINNGFNTLTKSITLTQLQYNLRVEPPGTSVTTSTNPATPMASPYAVMGGKRYTYNVRSNSTWRISNIAETHLSSYNNNGSFFASNPTAGDNVAVNATGTPNTTPGGGYRELFTTSNSRRGESGYADITYSSDPAGRFTAVTQRIFFPSAQFTVYGIVKMNDSNANFYNIFSGTNYQDSGSGRPQHIHYMLYAGGSYGTNLTGSGNSATPSSMVFTPIPRTVGANINSSSPLAVSDITDAVNAGADMLYISGSSTFGDDVAQSIFDNFLNKNKPVLLAIEDGDSFTRLWLKMGGGGGERLWKSNGPLNGNAPVYQFQNPNNGNDPLINGPFKLNGGSLANRYWGCDGNGSIAYWFTNNAGDTHTTNNLVVYSNARNQSGNTDSPPTGQNFSNQTMDNGYTCFRFTHYPLVFAADGGFGGCFNQTDSDRGPALIDTNTRLPALRTGYGGGSTKRDSANSYFIANFVAWAIQRRNTQ